MPVFVITGASGGGKSSILKGLADRGFQTEPEVGREIVREQTEACGKALPWQDRVAFRNLLFQRSLDVYEALDKANPAPIFFDRSFVEAIAYSRIIHEPVPSTMSKALQLHRFNNPVFVCMPWKEIFSNDPERRHDFEFAVKDYEANVSAYHENGYQMIDVPKWPVPKRVEFILENLVQAGFDTRT
ncbi:MAG: AAA family ATPase [Rhodospirillales bacterium]|nr:AAA family ATPase [Rhodospirillales bacterium]